MTLSGTTERMREEFMGAVREGRVDEVIRMASQHRTLLTAQYSVVRDNKYFQAGIAHYAAQARQPGIIRALARLGVDFNYIVAGDLSPLDALTTHLQAFPPQTPEETQQAKESVRAVLELSSEKVRNFSFGICGSFFYVEKMPWLPRLFLDHCETQDFKINPGIMPAPAALSRLSYDLTISPRGKDTCHETVETLAAAGLDFSSVIHHLAARQPELKSIIDEGHHGPLPEKLHLADEAVAQLLAKAEGWHTKWITAGAPVDELVKQGETAAPAQMALSALGVKEFFAPVRWQGHERQALEAIAALQEAAQPYWRRRLEQDLDITRMRRDAISPPDQVNIAAFLASRRPRRGNDCK